MSIDFAFTLAQTLSQHALICFAYDSKLKFQNMVKSSVFFLLKMVTNFHVLDTASYARQVSDCYKREL